MSDITNKANKLIQEKSPYLLQHAYNPVNWYPWSDEAFIESQKQNKPIFLSIGYSTCHWCHVMENESFEDLDVANKLNSDYIPIKVDREERPDVDTVYMNICQAMTGSGGWPLNIILTPDKKPIYAGTYFPKHSKYGIIGLLDILNKITDAWNTREDELIDKSNEIVNFINDSITTNSVSGEINNKIFDIAFDEFEQSYDTTYGGFSNAPKFPSPHQLLFLMRYYKNFDNPSALSMCINTLTRMYKGGIYDHIGGGFSRYSTDNKWLVPHFEKMLYDNALLLMAYTDAYAITKKPLFKEIITNTISYITREMTDINGGFYSALDADSEGIEGKFYIWSYDEIINILGKQNGEFFCKYYNITKKGNFEGNSIPNLINTDLQELTPPQVKLKIVACKDKLLSIRNERIHPHKDDKILTSWNGLMIAALSYAGRVLNNSNYITLARNAVHFINNNLFDSSGRLLIRYRDNQASNLGLLNDYSFMVWGLIELYEATLESEYLVRAYNLNNDMIKLFWDTDNGGFYQSGDDNENLIMRPKEIYDGALMSGNSVAANNILKLSRMLDLSLSKYYDGLITTFSKELTKTPRYVSYFLVSLMNYLGDAPDVVIVDDNDSNTDVKNSLITKLNQYYDAYYTLLLKSESLTNINPELNSKVAISDSITVYICSNKTCMEPITDLDKVIELLSKGNG